MVVAGSMPTTIQCTNVPLGASRSSTTTASSAVPFGVPSQRSGGGMFSPRHEKRSGMARLWAKAGLATRMPVGPSSPEQAAARHPASTAPAPRSTPPTVVTSETVGSPGSVQSEVWRWAQFVVG